VAHLRTTNPNGDRIGIVWIVDLGLEQGPDFDPDPLSGAHPDGVPKCILVVAFPNDLQVVTPTHRDGGVPSVLAAWWLFRRVGDNLSAPEETLEDSHTLNAVIDLTRGGRSRLARAGNPNR
jgi:hypothetical protein